MAEVIIPPEETEPELPEEQLPEVDKPTVLSKVITVKFNPLDTGMTSTANTRQSFYTTDTDAWVVFEIENMEAPNGEYSLVLYNKSDGSVFQRTGDIVKGAAYYKIEEEEIKHAGDWVGQVVITLVNGKTTTSRFSFNVAGHLLDGKDVRQIVIQDFETLMKQLEDLKRNTEIDFGDLLHSIEEFEQAAKTNEDIRQENENERIGNESARVEAEGVRETTFTENEAERSETFATNEADRKTNEVEREQNEETRQLNETNREETFETYDGRITGIEEDVVVEATNLIENGDFSKGTTGWGSTSHVNIAIVEKVLVATVSDVSGSNAITHKMSSINITDIHYLSFKFMPFRTHVPMIIGINGLTTPKEALANTTNKISLLYTPISLDYTMSFRLNRDKTDSMQIGSVVEFSNFIDINLTATFGAGNEPTAAQMDRLLEQFPNNWFDGTVNIFPARWALNELRRLDDEKANVKQEDWITPTLLNGWVSESSEEFSKVGYMKDEMGFVHLKGQVTGTTIDTQVFSLPTGYRPADKYLRFPTNSNNGQLGALWIGSSGTVTINKGPIYSVSLNGIIFKAEK